MKVGAILIAVASLALGTANAFNFEKNITVSGLSSGAFFAVQYHVSHSSTVSGAAVFAGGPYYCSKGEMINAINACMSTPFLINDYTLLDAAKSFEKDGKIDPLSNIENAPVFVYSGTEDTVVKRGVVEKASTLYDMMKASVKTSFDVPAEHSMPTLTYGNECSKLGSPFINRCQYDGAGLALSHVLSETPSRGRNTSFDADDLIKIDQAQYMQPGKSKTSIGDAAFAYVPKACRSSTGPACRLHVAFHGCEQSIDDIGMKFVEDAGYLEWATSFDPPVAVLFPQVKGDFLKNPKACWDWWGYADPDFANKEGSQVSMVAAMVDGLRAMS